MTELFNMSWGLNLDKQQIRKKYNALNSAKRRKTISKAEHKHKAATMGEFKRLSLGTGGGEPYSPPTVDGEDDEDSNMLPVNHPDHLSAITYPPSYVTRGSDTRPQATINQLRRNDHHFRQKWKLPGFGYGIDGVLIPFEEKPRNLPPNRNPQSFFSRKLRYAINCMAIGGPDGLFYHLDLRSPGEFSDSSTWRASRKKQREEVIIVMF